jgi:DNA-binding CsgD family transcriptional regulator
MIKEKISDEEIIYNIKLGREEALRLLLFLYEKKLIYEIKKYELVFNQIGYSYDDELRLIDSVVYNAIAYFAFNNATFLHYCKNVTKRTIIDIYRENLKSSYANISFDSDYIDLRLSDDSTQIVEQANFELLLKAIRQDSEENYQIVSLLLDGFSYQEIADKLHYDVKHLSYLIQKIRKKFKAWH